MKNSDKKLTLKTAGIVSGVLFGILFILRLYQVFAITDPATGFFTDHRNITVIPMYVLAVLSVGAAAILLYFTGDMPCGTRKPGKDYFHSATSLIFAVALAISAYEDFMIIGRTNQVYQSLSVSLKFLGGYTAILVPVFALLSALVMIADCVISATGREFSQKLAIPQLFPVLWAFFLTVSYFTITASYLKIAGLMFRIFSTAFLMIFLFEYARMCSGIGRKISVKAFYISGFIASGLLFVYSVPSLMITVFASEKAAELSPFTFYSLAGLLFTVSALINISKTKETE